MTKKIPYRRYKDFSSRMEKYRVKLESTLGIVADATAPPGSGSDGSGIAGAVPEKESLGGVGEDGNKTGSESSLDASSLSEAASLGSGGVGVGAHGGSAGSGVGYGGVGKKGVELNNEDKRKSARRKEFIMAELLATERTYVKVGDDAMTLRGGDNST